MLKSKRLSRSAEKMLFEYFNTTNQTSPHFERHENFVEPPRSLSCAQVASMPESQRCDFVKTSPACQVHRLLFNYNEFYFCYFKTDDLFSAIMGIIVLISISAYYFWMLSTLTDSFWCPALRTVSNILHLNENIAGVTVVAFGNAAPDFFMTIVGMDSNTRNPFSDTYATNLFVHSFIAGVLIVISPFFVEPAFFLRDVLFSLLYVVYMDYVIKTQNGIISIFDAIVILGIYVLYIAVMLIDQWLMMRKQRELARRTLAGLMDPGQMKSVLGIERFDDFIDKEEYYETPNTKLKEQFINSLNPVDINHFRRSNHIGKLFHIMRVPIRLCLTILIPYVNYQAHNYGWSKLLCCLQIVISPCFIVWSLSHSKTVYGYPPFLFILPIVAVLAYLAFICSRTDRCPRYYKYVCILTILVTTVIIYRNAGESLVMLDVLGIALRRSDALVGLTVLSWGNCIGDLLTNIALLKQGLPRMAFAACFGAPIFTTFCTLGVTFIYKTSKSPTHKIEVTEGTVGENSSIFLIIFLIALLFFGVTTNFMMRRCCGIFNIVYYIMYLIFNFLNEFEIVHAYGTDHYFDTKIEDAD